MPFNVVAACDVRAADTGQGLAFFQDRFLEFFGHGGVIELDDYMAP